MLNFRKKVIIFYSNLELKDSQKGQNKRKNLYMRDDNVGISCFLLEGILVQSFLIDREYYISNSLIGRNVSV